MNSLKTHIKKAKKHPVMKEAKHIDYDKDGVVELWVYTKYDEAPYMLYDLEEEQIVSRFVDNVPKDIRQALSQSVHT